MFGLGGYALGEGLKRITGPVGWVALVAAVVGALALWRFYKAHEERLLTHAEAALDGEAPAGR